MAAYWSSKTKTRMTWSKLLCEERMQESETNKNSFDIRNGFDKDYDRMISFSSVRRLQDKTQVFPLQTNDYTRTRLTHSIEVSALGRSIGNIIVDRLTKGDTEKGASPLVTGAEAEAIKKLPSLLAVTCLVHDLGNPPFGHFGETSIQKWFECFFNADNNASIPLSELEKNDFIKFDGNPQTLRILGKLQFLNGPHGANFTFGSLATLIKYPVDSSSKEKFGYFQSEKDLFKIIVEKTGMITRHPATYLLEAADDIANSATDVEDGVKKGVVNWNEVYADIKNHKKLGVMYKKDFEELDRKINRIKSFEDESGEGLETSLIAAQFFRIWAQGKMIQACTETFIKHYDEIMTGTFPEGKSLIDISEANELYKYLKYIATKRIYVCDEVLQLEVMGNKVISELLDIFVNAVLKIEKYDHKSMEGKLYKLISSNFRHVIKYDQEGNIRDRKDLTVYDKLKLVTDFIAGMTDTYALDLYQKLTGMK
jgi:dGTPase